MRLTTTGSVQITTAVKSTKTDNPALSLNSRRKTFFDFDQKIQATVAASVGDRMKFNLNYNTDATFDFDSKTWKLQYEGTEDDIVRNIEAGNVSMTTGSSLIRGSTALFGIKSTLQFGLTDSHGSRVAAEFRNPFDQHPRRSADYGILAQCR